MQNVIAKLLYMVTLLPLVQKPLTQVNSKVCPTSLKIVTKWKFFGHFLLLFCLLPNKLLHITILFTYFILLDVLWLCLSNSFSRLLWILKLKKIKNLFLIFIKTKNCINLVYKFFFGFGNFWMKNSITIFVLCRLIKGQ